MANREILFRGKMENGAWICGTYFPPANTIILHKNTPDENSVDTYKDFSVIPETVGQFTGLTDKNGKKIFEGDIVKYTRTNIYAPSCNFHGQTIVSLHKILWDSSVSAFVSVHYDLSEKRIIGKGSAILYDDRAKANIVEVIGNIHDNPELLEVE